MIFNLNGIIVPNGSKAMYDAFQVPCICPADVEKALKQANGDVLQVQINSPGGDVFAGSEIYTRFMGYSGKIVTRIMGIAASAASVAAMAGECEMSPTSLLMIHNVSSYANGDYRSMEHEADILKTANQAICAAYAIKSKMKERDLLDLMNKETWMTAQQALKMRFIDRILFQEPDPQGFTPGKNSDNLKAHTMAAKLNLLKLGGHS